MIETIGGILKNLRNEKNISLKTVTQQTNISLKKLEFLENNSFPQFPGKFYYVSYIKEYLKVLKYDQKSFFDQYQGMIDSINFKKSNPQVQFSKINYLRFRRKKIFLFLIVFLILLILFAFFYLFILKGELDLKNIFGTLAKFFKP